MTFEDVSPLDNDSRRMGINRLLRHFGYTDKNVVGPAVDRESGIRSKYLWPLFVSQQGICPGCDTTFLEHEFHVDHIVSLANGGSNELNNLQLLCQDCNLQKHTGTMDALAYRRYREKILF